MKLKLFAVALMSVALFACSKKEESVSLPPPANQPSLNAPAQEPAPTPAPGTAADAAPQANQPSPAAPEAAASK